MMFDVLGYNFPHWKTNNGILNLVSNGFIPNHVILQQKKELKFKQSKYRISPICKESIHPKDLCKLFDLTVFVKDHDEWEPRNQFAIILGARILSKGLIERYPKGILNIHPGILPGNRGLDNLKWSIINNLPIGITAHWIDEKIDMGRIIKKVTVPIYHDDTIRDVFIRSRQMEIDLLIDVMKDLNFEGEPCEFSKKFDCVPDELDKNIEQYWIEYKKNNIK